jgi:hypothetical protein
VKAVFISNHSNNKITVISLDTDAQSQSDGFLNSEFVGLEAEYLLIPAVSAS